MYGYIYITTNLINGKKYIGQHKAKKRLSVVYKGSGILIKKALEKYGSENFTCELIEWCNSKEALNDREIFWIDYYDSNYSDSDDLISIGTIGLIKGVDTFSKDKGVKITTYCARCIENEILMYFRTNNKYNKNVSINETVGYDKDGNEIEILDVLKTPETDYVEKIDLKDNINLLKRYLLVLGDREKEIIARRYGLNNREEETQKVIAKKMGISRSYVSRIEKRALTKMLREFIRERKLPK